MEKESAKKITPPEKRQRLRFGESVDSKDGTLQSMASTAAESAENSISAGEMEQLDLPISAMDLPEFIQHLRAQYSEDPAVDELLQVAAVKIEALAWGNAQAWHLKREQIGAQVEFNRLHWLVGVALGESELFETDRPLELLSNWYHGFHGKRVKEEEGIFKMKSVEPAGPRGFGRSHCCQRCSFGGDDS
jgi:hypothetical protein